MWRALVVLGLTVATMGSAEARGLRLRFRPHIFVSSRPFVPLTERKEETPLIFRRDDRARPLSVTSVLDTPGPVMTPAASPSPAAAKTRADQAAHWCDNGKVVGTGAGFCVLNVSAGAPS